MTSSVSSIYTVISYFIPQIKALPVFGYYISEHYLLNFQPSPAYVGQGIIMGFATTTYMFFGMVLGWCVLSPLAQSKGWAPGPIDDWKEGSEGWIMWISLSIMISDSVVSLAVTVVKAINSLVGNFNGESYHGVPSAGEHQGLISGDEIQSDEDITSSTYHGETNNSDSSVHSGSTSGCDSITVGEHSKSTNHAYKSTKTKRPKNRNNTDLQPKHQISGYVTWIGLALSCLLCVLATRKVFGPIVPIYATSISVILSLLLSVLGVKALGETDLNPVSGIGKLSQLLFAVIIPRNQPGAILINLISGAISEAATQQAGDLMQDLKTGFLLGASPKAQFIAQIYGSIFSIFLSAIMYKFYNALYQIPGPIFKVPTAVIWIDCARLVNGAGLPERVIEFAIFFGVVFGIISLLKNTLTKDNCKYYKYLKYLPSGVPVGIGIYNVPSFTLARFIGGLISFWWMKRIKSENSEKVKMIIFSSGMILGEGVFSVVNMVFTSLGIPHL
ncbi:unnamed protein product [Ambrosiozyma monospora]|uniref:Unnamed protein product n=1 Tax=Ambrosiozyma monospora TaxID=43982 RepID=A0A9W7DFT3_AMBMO|nr:unnamed protein product [Ambrosiozyma monospora]